MRKLYHTSILPGCRKIRIMMKEKDLSSEGIVENPWEDPSGMLALSAAASHPVLVEDDGRMISGAYAIAEYLEESYPGITLLGTSSAERAEVRRIVEWFDHRMNLEVSQPILCERVLKKWLRLGGPDSNAIRCAKDCLRWHLDYIGELLRDRYWLSGESLTLADITASAHLSALDYLGDVPWEHNEAAKEWYALMKSRPSFRFILAERIPAFRPPEHYENPDF